jgi:hypothetical protein
MSDFKITGFGCFRTLEEEEEELVVLMKRTGSCKQWLFDFGECLTMAYLYIQKTSSLVFEDHDYEL